MCTVGTAESIGILIFQFSVYSIEIFRWQYNVRVENDKILAFCTFGTVVAALSRSAVVLGKIVYIQRPGISFAYILACEGAAVFNDDNFKILESL